MRRAEINILCYTFGQYYFKLLNELFYMFIADVFHINDRQNSECQVSNFCERSLSLKCEDRNEKKPVLTFNASSTDPWDAVCSQILGTKNVSETLTIEGEGELHYKG